MKKKKIAQIIFSVIGIVAGLCVIVVGFFAVKGAVMWNEARTAEPVDELVQKIRAADDFTEYSELPEFYINAVIATEDRKFETHCGINVKSIIRALIADIKTLSFEQGGSTITQQLAKNLWFTQDKKFERKFAEIYAAFYLEKTLTKDDIFELYANTIYFGSGYYGITDAARGYFGKTPSELSDYECAMLAGLPNAPSAYSPDASPELARQRLSIVLESMKQVGSLSPEAADELLNSV